MTPGRGPGELQRLERRMDRLESAGGLAPDGPVGRRRPERGDARL